MEGSRLSVRSVRRAPGGVPRGTGNHRPARGVRGKQGLHGGDRRSVRDRLGARGSRAGSAHLPQALQRRDPLAGGDRSDPGAPVGAAVDPTEVERIELEIFQVAYDIIGGGEEGGKKEIRTKEEADHSLPYLLAVALLDGQVMPEQFAPERITRPDVQGLLRRVAVRPAADLSARFPSQHACRLRLHLSNGSALDAEKDDYEGFLTRPMGWEAVVAKFERLADRHLGGDVQAEILKAVHQLDEIEVTDLTELLAHADTRRGGKGVSR